MERLLAAQRVIISRLLREEMEGGGELEDGVVGGFDVLGEMVGEVLGEFERCGWRGRAEGSGCGEMTPPMSPQDGGWRRPMIV